MQKVHENKALAVKPCIAEILWNSPNSKCSKPAPRALPDKTWQMSQRGGSQTRNQTRNMQHATISATWICRPVMFTKQKASKRHMPTGPSCSCRTWRDPMPPTIPLCEWSWTWHGDGRERIRGLSHKADIIWIFVGRCSSPCPAN